MAKTELCNGPELWMTVSYLSDLNCNPQQHDPPKSRMGRGTRHSWRCTIFAHKNIFTLTCCAFLFQGCGKSDITTPTTPTDKEVVAVYSEIEYTDTGNHFKSNTAKATDKDNFVVESVEKHTDAEKHPGSATVKAADMEIVAKCNVIEATTQLVDYLDNTPMVDGQVVWHKVYEIYTMMSDNLDVNGMDIKEVLVMVMAISDDASSLRAIDILEFSSIGLGENVLVAPDSGDRLSKSLKKKAYRFSSYVMTHYNKCEACGNRE